MAEGKSFYGPVTALLIGGFFLTASFLIPESSPDYAKRWLVFLFGMMICAQGIWLWKRKHQDLFSMELNAILESVLLIIMFGVFASVFLAGAFVFGDEWRGGFFFLPQRFNNLLARIISGLVGGVLALMISVHTIKLVGMVWRWLMTGSKR